MPGRDRGFQRRRSRSRSRTGSSRLRLRGHGAAARRRVCGGRRTRWKRHHAPANVALMPGDGVPVARRDGSEAAGAARAQQAPSLTSTPGLQAQAVVLVGLESQPHTGLLRSTHVCGTRVQVPLPRTMMAHSPVGAWQNSRCPPPRCRAGRSRGRSQFGGRFHDGGRRRVRRERERGDQDRGAA